MYLFKMDFNIILVVSKHLKQLIQTKFKRVKPLNPRQSVNFSLIDSSNVFSVSEEIFQNKESQHKPLYLVHLPLPMGYIELSQCLLLHFHLSISGVNSLQCTSNYALAKLQLNVNFLSH